ncbi:MAG: cache domain-containing protein, partial [Magnetospirillum sp.]|nr:cache domain-containing protein [Magnetospirillum sp.]
LIGTGDYVSAVEAGLKADALERLRAIHLTRGGRLMVVDQQGTIRLFPDQPELEGKQVDTVDDSAEGLAIKAVWRKAQAGGGAVEFQLADPVTGKPYPWQAWVEAEPTFNWSVAALAPNGENRHPDEGQDYSWAWRYVVPAVMLLVVLGWAVFLGLTQGRANHDT